MNSKKNIQFDVAIIGGGVCGANVARTLSAYSCSTVLLEKEADVGFGVSKANSGIIHAGFHHQTNTLKARLEIQGNLMFERLHHELGFPFKRVGILVVAFSDEEMSMVEHLYTQGLENNVPNLEICSAQRIRYLEPEVNADAVGGLYAPSGGIIEPYRFVFALVECAKQNGVMIKTDFTVHRTERKRGQYIISSKEGDTVKAKYIVNAAGLYADTVSRILGAERFKITARKGEEYLLDRNAAGCPQHVLFPLPTKKSKGILVIPTVEGTTMIGPTALEVPDKGDVSTTAENLERIFAQAKHMSPNISRRDIITSFAGMRPVLEGNDFYIDISKKARHVIQVAGIQSPGLTASPAIGVYVKDLLKKDGLQLIEKKQYSPNLAMVVRAIDQDPPRMQALIQKNPAYGNIVCRCESVSEAQIIEAIHKGHTTVDGIKFYTRAGMGRCQGGFCTYKILKIIARETGCSITDITKRGGKSQMVHGVLAKSKLRPYHD